MAGNSPLATLHAEGPFNYFCVPRGLQNALRKHGVGMPIRWPPALLDKVWSHHLASQAEPCPPFSPLLPQSAVLCHEIFIKGNCCLSQMVILLSPCQGQAAREVPLLSTASL